MFYTGTAIPKNVDAEVIIWKCLVYSMEFYERLAKPNTTITDKRYFCQSHFNGIRIVKLEPHERPCSKFDRPPLNISPRKKKMNTKSALEAISMSDEDDSDQEQTQQTNKQAKRQTMSSRIVLEAESESAPISKVTKRRGRKIILEEDSSQSESEEIKKIVQRRKSNASSKTSSRSSSR